jgi:hypothetical protein
MSLWSIINDVRGGTFDKILQQKQVYCSFYYKTCSAAFCKVAQKLSCKDNYFAYILIPQFNNSKRSALITCNLLTKVDFFRKSPSLQKSKKLYVCKFSGSSLNLALMFQWPQSPQASEDARPPWGAWVFLPSHMAGGPDNIIMSSNMLAPFGDIHQGALQLQHYNFLKIINDLKL